MLQRTRVFAISLVFSLAGIAAPATAHAWPFGKLLHLHPREVQEQDGRITFQLYNKGGLVQEVKVAGRVYTLLPHDGLKITAPEGTQVYAASKGFGHRNGDVLFTVTPEMKYDTVSID
jgi:murein DD-endopeptidase MepM/ murein hydrolase activator NlpD